MTKLNNGNLIPSVSILMIQMPKGRAIFGALCPVQCVSSISQNSISNRSSTTLSALSQVALGVYKAPNDNTTEQAVEWALDAGYRHIDGAARYANEEAVGKALKNWCAKSGVPREQVFVTSKLWDADHERAEDAIADSLKKLQLEYMDMYLIHSPGNMGEEARIKAWKGLEDAVDKGLIKNIGVSNVSTM